MFHNRAGTGTVALGTIHGTAPCSGHAVGMIAISDPLSGGDAAHFTTDVALTAKFGPSANDGTGGGVSGTVDNFVANGASVPWSAELKQAPWLNNDGTNRFSTYADGHVHEHRGTVWCINGNAAAAANWEGVMFGETPGNHPTGDGSNVPTTVIGGFESYFGLTLSMVGAFAATRDD